jgi:hypothetical protein
MKQLVHARSGRTLYVHCTAPVGCNDAVRQNDRPSQGFPTEPGDMHFACLTQKVRYDPELAKWFTPRRKKASNDQRVAPIFSPAVD